jgi:hypothetical protein
LLTFGKDLNLIGTEVITNAAPANQPLSKELAMTLAKKIASDKGFRSIHGIHEEISVVSGHWIWIGETIGPHGHVDRATVELAQDGLTNNVTFSSREAGWLP